MKKTIDAVLVVEGKTDVAYLSNYFDVEFVTTNGSEIPEDTISYLKTLSKEKDIIVLTDPDSPGKRIRDILDQQIPNLKHVFINKEYAIKNHKVGVAECDIDEIFNALNHVFTNKKPEKEYISYNDLLDLGLIGEKNSKQKRDLLSKKLCIGANNGKSLYKKLNMLRMDKETLERKLYE